MTYVSVFVSSPDTHSERRFDSDLTVGQLKVSAFLPTTWSSGRGDARSTAALTRQDKLFPITGILQQYQVLSLYQSSESQQPLAALNDDNQTLAAYGVKEFNCIKVSFIESLNS